MLSRLLPLTRQVESTYSFFQPTFIEHLLNTALVAVTSSGAAGALTRNHKAVWSGL